jgi:hypothetical protein
VEKAGSVREIPVELLNGDFNAEDTEFTEIKVRTKVVPEEWRGADS